MPGKDKYGSVISTTANTYDKVGNVLTTTDGDGNVTTNLFDGNQLVGTLVTDGRNSVVRTTHHAFDLAGNVGRVRTGIRLGLRQRSVGGSSAV
jgi:YD repeat-containing protein